MQSSTDDECTAGLRASIMLLALHTIFIFPVSLTKELAEQNSKFQVAKWFLDIRTQGMYQILRGIALCGVMFSVYGVHHT